MLTADWVRVREKGGELTIVALSAKERARALEMAEQLVGIAQRSVGEPRDQVLAEYEAVEAGPRERRIKGGLVKLLEDRSIWKTQATVEPADLRRQVFQAASEARRRCTASDPWDRDRVVAAVAESLGLTPESVEQSLYADLAHAQRLESVEPISASELIEAYERGHAQAILLRAIRLEATVRCASASAARAMFQRLKFLQLLCTVEPVGTPAAAGEGYRLVVDGPMSLFESGTRYGQKLALMLPVLERCASWELEARIQWSRDRAPCVFRIRGGSEEGGSLGERAGEAAEPECSEAAAGLIRSFERLRSDWQVRPSTAVLNLPGVGVCVPDLRFERAGKTVYLEILGFWSRDAVFRRVDMVERGMDVPILFAVSSRLRVSEAVLEEHPSAALYVYRDTPSARSVAERLDRLTCEG